MLSSMMQLMVEARRQIYLPVASNGTDSVQRSSMERLRLKVWLNNEVINYFFKVCLANRDKKICDQQLGRRRSHFFNSFFVQKLFNEKSNDPNLRGRFNCNNVKHWSAMVLYSISSIYSVRLIVIIYIGRWLLYTWRKDVSIIMIL
jgi:Ulp1 family protease